MSDHTSSWWADGSVSRARRTTAAALAILLGLGGVSTFVWLSPEDSPPRSALGAVLGALDPTAELQQQHDALTAEHAATVEALGQETASAADLREQLAELELSLAAANDSLAAARAENGALSEQLADAADAGASGGTGGTSSGGSGGTSSGGSGGTASNGAGGSTGGSGSGSGSSGGSGGSGSSGGSGGGTTPTTPEVTAPPLADLVAPSSPYYGMYTAQAPFNWAVYDDVSSKLDARPDVVGYFSGWDEEFRTSAVERAWARDTLPIMTWESRPIGAANDVVDEPEYALPRILEGDFDAYLHQYAQDVVELGLPLGIRLNHEMNGTWYPWSESTSSGGSINGNSPGDYVKVWQHVHDIFEAEGANDLVMWIWAPNIINNLPTVHRTPEHLASLYPGDDYVDWVGLSGYLRPPYRSDQTFTFDYTFGPSLAQLRDLTDKPILLAEVGASETGGHKPAWVTSFFDGLADPANDDIVGFAWFNLAVTTYVQGERSTNDWRIDSRQDSLDAFREGLLDPVNDFQLLPY